MGGNIREQEEPKYAFIILLLFIKWRRVLSKFSEMLMLNYVKLKRRELYTFVSSVCDTGSNQLNEKLPNLKVVCLRERGENMDRKNNSCICVEGFLSVCGRKRKKRNRKR